MTRSPYLVLFKCLLLAVASLVALEGLLRVPMVRRFLPLPSPYYSQSVMGRERTLAEYKAKFGEPEWITIGSSIARANVNIGELQNLTGRRCFGLGMSAVSPGGAEVYWNRFWSKRVAMPQLALHLVRSSDFGDRYDPAHDEVLSKGRIERSWQESTGAEKTVQEKLLSLRTFQYYGVLSKAIAGDRHPFLGDPFSTDLFGSRSEPGSFVSENRKAARRKHSEPPIGTFAVAMSHSNAFQIFRRLQSDFHGNYVLVFCPEFIDAWDSPDALADWRVSLKSLCAKAGFRFVDPTSLDPEFVSDPSNYLDLIHYNQKGSERFTKLLVLALGKG